MTPKQRRAIERRQDAPLICPMLGGMLKQSLRRFAVAWTAISARTGTAAGADQREDLVAARYRDWKLGKEES